jgi:hypothetical protein
MIARNELKALKIHIENNSVKSDEAYPNRKFHNFISLSSHSLALSELNELQM